MIYDVTACASVDKIWGIRICHGILVHHFEAQLNTDLAEKNIIKLSNIIKTAESARCTKERKKYQFLELSALDPE